MLKYTNGLVKEISYDIKDEAKLASIFGVGNGYFGLRGSFEELGEVFIQGLYIRGVFDQIVEIPQTFCDNIYMKQYYFDVQKLKEFELEDSCINICDPISCKIYINGQQFLPWEGKVLKWERYIDYRSGALLRKVTWDDGNGNISKFVFERLCSFSNNHIILQKVSIEKINHNLDIEVDMGIDTLVKTNGQHKSVLTDSTIDEFSTYMNFYMGNKYNHEVALKAYVNAEGASFDKTIEKDKVYAQRYKTSDKKATFKKVIVMYASVDKINDYKEITKGFTDNFDVLYKEHLKAYKKAFKQIDIKIEGDEKIDTLVRYANYQTLIGVDRYDSVYSLSAKNLTAEKYNQFVWWDAEIFQLPFVISNFPEAAKTCLEYRYRLLEQSKKNAKEDGYDGAKYAFCSSVNGDENVWIYARHPFLQIHISADVGYGIINYYRNTGDDKFMKEKGLDILVEVLKYFRSRSTFRDNMYHLDNVTGTDEHHPYINDDAYTSYEVRFLARETLRLLDKFNQPIDKESVQKIKDLSDLYCPVPSKEGIIPQFDGYLSLKKYLPLAGNGAATGFQMKASGLYHLSQIIKQPDVLNLYTYLDIGMDEKIYKKNYKFYLKMCESSSSLTYPVHTIAALDFHDKDVFYENLLNSLEIDIRDVHNCAYQGVHAGCLAGGWYMVYRGIIGAFSKEDKLVLKPNFQHPFDKVSMNLIYHGVNLHIEIDHKKMVITSSKTDVVINYKSKDIIHNGRTIIRR